MYVTWNKEPQMTGKLFVTAMYKQNMKALSVIFLSNLFTP